MKKRTYHCPGYKKKIKRAGHGAALLTHARVNKRRKMDKYRSVQHSLQNRHDHIIHQE